MSSISATRAGRGQGPVLLQPPAGGCRRRPLPEPAAPAPPAPEPAALLAAPGANGTALQSGELNYCAKIEEETNYVGQDIKYDNGSNHWFPVRPPHLQMSRGER